MGWGGFKPFVVFLIPNRLLRGGREENGRRGIVQRGRGSDADALHFCKFLG